MMKERIRRNTSSETIIAIVAVAFVLTPLVVFSLFSFYKVSQSLTDIIKSELEANSIIVAHGVNNFISERIIDARVISQVDVLESQDLNAKIQYLTEVVTKNKWIVDIDVLDTTGAIIASSGRQSEQGRLLWELYSIEQSLFLSASTAQHGQVYVSEAMLFGNGPAVLFITPITDGDNLELIGLLSIEVNLEHMEEVVSLFYQRIVGEKYVYIVDNDGRVIISDDPTVKFLSLLPDLQTKPELLDALSLQGEIGNMVYTNHIGDQVVASYADMAEFGENSALDWSLIAIAPMSEITAPIAQLKQLLFIIASLIALLSAFLAYRVVSFINKNLANLAAQADVISQGNFAPQKLLESNRQSAFNTLVIAINRMQVNIQKYVTELLKNEHEIRVLNRVYAVLSGINSLIVRANNRDELFKEVCNIAVVAAEFRMALLCMVDGHTRRIAAVAAAAAGKDKKLLTKTKGLLESGEDISHTLIAQAISNKQIIVCNDAANDPRLMFGKQYAESGVGSMVTLPLMVSGEAVGSLTLYAYKIDFFQAEELTLLAELADNIAFAIGHIENQARIKYLAYYDQLTGLGNRSLFLERLEVNMRSAVSGGHKLAIGLIDLERFKNINDSLGLTAGDMVLKQVAQWLTSKLDNADLLARVDADHFAFLMPHVKSESKLPQLAKRLMAGFLAHTFDVDDASLRIGIKVGLALFPDDGADANTLYTNAETALKNAKVSGDPYLFYKQKMNSAVADNLTLENQLRLAIDNEEFVLHYQPKVDLATGKVTSAEALIRWNNPHTGLVPPNKFIPILEETGMIYEVGRWALRQSIEDNLRWRLAGLPKIRIAVNVSPLQLRNHDFLNEISQAIAIDAQAASGLELEITESQIMTNIRYNITTLKAIRAMGITIALDDFGTGFSSLNYLAKLPLDTLKIDRSFIIEMHAQEGLEMISTIIRVAHALKLKVVAEGVETEEQLHQLGTLNCDEMQGYLFSKPVPADVFEKMFLAPSQEKE